MLAIRDTSSSGTPSGVAPLDAAVKTAPAKTSSQAADWTTLVAQIKTGDDAGLERLYQVFSRGIRYYLCRQLGPEELEDRVHESFLTVVHAIRKGELREPERLMGFVRTIVRRQVATYIDQAVHKRRDQIEIEPNVTVVDSKEDPEEQAIARQKVELMKAVLRTLSPRDREILERFYLKEEPQEQICREMDLSETQFRLLKSRAKARFGEIGKKKLASGVFSVLIRSQAS
jgi:RNA polymerase sigma-70 factor (ECF subfamily)